MNVAPYLVRYNSDTDTYFIKAMYDGQVYEMGFQLGGTDRTLVVNVYARVYTKRKHQCSDEDNCTMTGKHPMHSYSFFNQAFDALVKRVWGSEMDWYESYDKMIVMVFWTDNRRRNAYYKMLKKKGYDYSMYEGKKCIAKTYNRGYVFEDDFED